MKGMLTGLLALCLAAGVGTTVLAAQLEGQKEKVFYTEEVLYGTSAAAEGFTIGTLTTVDGYLHWDTQLHLGAQPTWESQFSFTPTRDWYSLPPQPRLELYLHSGIGVSGGTLDFWTDGNLAFLAPALEDVASRTQPGEEHTETVVLKDYIHWFPVEVDGNFIGPEGQWQRVDWPDAPEFFRIPVGEHTAELTIGKREDGGVYSADYSMDQAPDLYYSAVSDGEGWYLLYSARMMDGTPIEGREPGLYYLPMVAAPQDQEVWLGNRLVDTDGVELCYPIQGGEELYLVDGGSKLLLVCDGPGLSREMVVLDKVTMEEVQRFPLEEDSYRQGSDSLTVEDDYLVWQLNHSRSIPEGEELVAQQVQVWAMGEDGRYAKTLDCDISQGGLDTWYWDGVYYDGERLLLARYLDSYYDPSVAVVVCSPTQLTYAAQWQSSQARSWGQIRLETIRTPFLSVT